MHKVFAIAFAVMWFAPALQAGDCAETMAAQYRGQIAPNGPWIASQCPEACGPANQAGTFLRLEQDANLLDWIYVWCPGDYEGEPIPASGNCWNCIDGCAGPDCPDGELCVPDDNQRGSDCLRYGCTDPAYMVVEDAATGIPYCRRKEPCPPDPPCTPATVTVTGPTAIRPGATCTWSADALSECGNPGYTYNWYVSNTLVGSGPWYSGGKPNGLLAGASWKIRADAIYNGLVAGRKEITVKEDAAARFCVH